MTALATVGVLTVGGSPAQAADDPVGGLLHKTAGTVHKVVHRTTSRHASGAASGAASGSAAGRSSSHAAHVQVGRHPLADVSRGSAGVGKDGDSRADSTLVGVAGHEVVGSHARSGGKERAHGPVARHGRCTLTADAFCLDLFFADSWASRSGTTSDAGTHTGVAELCLGDDDPATCKGVVSAAALTAGTGVHRDGARTTSAADSTGAAVCLRPDEDGCAVDARALTSHGEAASDGTRSGGSEILGLGLLGTDVLSFDDPASVGVPQDCAALCLDGNSAVEAGQRDDTGTGNDAVDVTGLGDQLGTTLAGTSTSAGDERTTTPATPEDPTTQTLPATTAGAQGSGGSSGTPASDAGAASVADQVLPGTGGVASRLLGLGILLTGAGAAAVATARSRRRQVVHLVVKK